MFQIGLRGWRLSYFFFDWLLGDANFVIAGGLSIGLNSAHVATDVKLLFVSFLLGEGVHRDKAWLLARLKLEDYCVHPEDGAGLPTGREKLLTADSACDDVADERIALGQICSEIHLLPLVSLLDSQTREAKMSYIH